MSREEKKKKKKTIIISAMIHGVLLALLIFIFAWKEPDPPIPEYGIELNFGLDEVGSGDIQPQTTTPAESQESEAAEEPVDAPDDPSESVDEAAESTPEVVQPAESPHTVKEEPKPVVKKDTKVEEKPKPVEKKPEEKKPVEDPKPEVKTGPESDKDTDAKSHGDNTNKEGDKGSPDGKVDERALYGQAGGGGGFSFNMTGWRPDFEPKPKDTSGESGRLVFQITINEYGEITRIVTVERGVSAAVERIYRDEVSKLTFTKTSDNTRVAPSSTGTIAFVLKSQ